MTLLKVYFDKQSNGAIRVIVQSIVDEIRETLLSKFAAIYVVLLVVKLNTIAYRNLSFLSKKAYVVRGVYPPRPLAQLPRYFDPPLSSEMGVRE